MERWRLDEAMRGVMEGRERKKYRVEWGEDRSKKYGGTDGSRSEWNNIVIEG